LDDSVADVRTATYKVFGVLTDVFGEQAIKPYLENLDRQRLQKLKDHIDSRPKPGFPSFGLQAPPIDESSSNGLPVVASNNLSVAAKPISSIKTSAVGRKVTAKPISPAIQSNNSSKGSPQSLAKGASYSTLTFNGMNDIEQLSLPTQINGLDKVVANVNFILERSSPNGESPAVTDEIIDTEWPILDNNISSSNNLKNDFGDKSLNESNSLHQVLFNMKAELDRFYNHMSGAIDNFEERLKVKENKSKEEARFISEYDKELHSWNEDLQEKNKVLTAKLLRENQKRKDLENLQRILEKNYQAQAQERDQMLSDWEIDHQEKEALLEELDRVVLEKEAMSLKLSSFSNNEVVKPVIQAADDQSK